MRGPRDLGRVLELVGGPGGGEGVIDLLSCACHACHPSCLEGLVPEISVILPLDSRPPLIIINSNP